MGRRKSKLKRSKNKNKSKDKNKTKAPVCDRSSPAPPWIELPRDVTANILQRLGAIEMLEVAQRVCATWRSVCQDPAMWRVVDIRNSDARDWDELEMMCRLAVDRSQGNLLELHIEYFGDDDMLRYITERSSHLRRFSLARCYEISPTALCEEVKRLPQLEELHLIIMPQVEAAHIESIGISCPMLKSFTFNEHGSKYNDLLEDDEFMEGQDNNGHAVVVAKNMPNLRHLRLFSNSMKNEGLQAILDGCPLLESLDIRQCYGVDLGGELGKRCTQQIKALRRPYDSVDDYEWDAGDSANEDPYSSVYSDGYPFGYDSFGSYDSFDYDDYTNPFSGEYHYDDELWFVNSP